MERSNSWSFINLLKIKENFGFIKFLCEEIQCFLFYSLKDESVFSKLMNRLKQRKLDSDFIVFFVALILL